MLTIRSSNSLDGRFPLILRHEGLTCFIQSSREVNNKTLQTIAACLSFVVSVKFAAVQRFEVRTCQMMDPETVL